VYSIIDFRAIGDMKVSTYFKPRGILVDKKQ
jgi:hypothetical protein